MCIRDRCRDVQRRIITNFKQVSKYRVSKTIAAGVHTVGRAVRPWSRMYAERRFGLNIGGHHQRRYGDTQCTPAMI